MNSNNPQSPAAILVILWWAMQLTPVLIGVGLFVLHSLEIIKPVNPDYASYLVFAGFIAIPVALFYANYFRNHERRIKHAVEIEQANIQQNLQQLTILMIIGMAMAEFPAAISVPVYVLSGDLTWPVILLTISFLLGFRLKPDISP